jgi:hypothetical protein
MAPWRRLHGGRVDGRLAVDAGLVRAVAFGRGRRVCRHVVVDRQIMDPSDRPADERKHQGAPSEHDRDDQDGDGSFEATSPSPRSAEANDLQL